MISDDAALSWHSTPRAAGERFRATELLPLVRAALVRGGGPPAVLAWIQLQSEPSSPEGGAEHDEGLVRGLAERLAVTLNALIPGFGTGVAGATTLAPRPGRPAWGPDPPAADK
jgi:hypothetical protein